MSFVHWEYTISVRFMVVRAGWDQQWRTIHRAATLQLLAVRSLTAFAYRIWFIKLSIFSLKIWTLLFFGLMSIFPNFCTVDKHINQSRYLRRTNIMPHNKSSTAADICLSAPSAILQRRLAAACSKILLIIWVSFSSCWSVSSEKLLSSVKVSHQDPKIGCGTVSSLLKGGETCPLPIL